MIGTPIKRIQINEVDLTSPGQSPSITDVVYVPGFSKRALNMVVFTMSGEDTSDITATAHLPVSTICSNVIDKLSWKCKTSSATSMTWEEIPYVEAYENLPILCQSVQEFENYFGDNPYLFEDDISYFVTGGSASTDPKFTAHAIPTNGVFVKEGDADKSYIYAKTLIKLGIPVLYDAFVDRNTDGTAKAPNLVDFYSYLETTGVSFDALQDKGEYTVKYLTTGGYPSLEHGESELGVAGKMLQVAAERGDCVALLDHTNNAERPLGVNASGSLYNDLTSGDTSAVTSAAEYGAIFTPWGNYGGLPAAWENAEGRLVNTTLMPASFGYLVALAKSIKTNANWVAIAGVTRGQVPYLQNLNTLERLSNTIADSYQARNGLISLNAITNIKPYGLTIWGNRTLKNNSVAGNLVATSFLNIRNLVSEVKKEVYTACKRVLFEQNSDVLWINFKSMVTPLLDRMLTSYGLSGYKIIKGTTTEKAKLVATIKLYPLYALEEIVVTIELADEDISVM